MQVVRESYDWITPNGKCPNLRCHAISSCLAVRFEGKVEGICNVGIDRTFASGVSWSGCPTGLQITGSVCVYNSDVYW